MRPQVLICRVLLHLFAHILQRQAVAAELSSERENLLGQLIEYLDECDQSFDSSVRDSHRQSFGCGVSPAVAGIMLCRQTHLKFLKQLEVGRPIFKNLRAFGQYEALCQGLVRKAKQLEGELFGDWVSDRLADLDNGDLSLRMRGQLMEIPLRGKDEGAMVVNYDEKLVVLLREVRQLSELGCAVPREILETAVEGEKYYRYGVMLKKVANYWNSLSDQLIPSQRPMLLNALKAFEKIVRSRKSENGDDITWKTPTECEHYVERLQSAAEKLSSENLRLRSAHQKLGKHVVSLMNIDLLRQKDAWKKKWQEAVQLMDELKAKYPEEHMLKWMRHWDEQLYKALEANYQMGLESLNENLPEIRADLVFAQRCVQFRPGLEELRVSYYREMKRFVASPSSFGGFGNKKSLCKNVFA